MVDVMVDAESRDSHMTRGSYITPRVAACHGSRHEPEYNVLNRVVIEEGYVRVTMRV